MRGERLGAGGDAGLAGSVRCRLGRSVSVDGAVMAFDKSGLDEYNTVPERIGEFREKHPEGCLRPADLTKPFEIVEVDGRRFVVYVAAAYRGPDDGLPGIGVAWEPFPGKTPYTKDSELQNAETSAWGRAIVAVLAADARKGIATAEDVRNRQADREEADEPAVQNQEAIDLFAVIMDARDDPALRLAWEAVGEAEAGRRVSRREANQLRDHVRKRKAAMETVPASDEDQPPAEPAALVRQRKRAFALFPKIGITDDAAKHEYAAKVLGWQGEVESFSFKTLTAEDWKKLADHLAAEEKRATAGTP